MIYQQILIGELKMTWWNHRPIWAYASAVCFPKEGENAIDAYQSGTLLFAMWSKKERSRPTEGKWIWHLKREMIEKDQDCRNPERILLAHFYVLYRTWQISNILSKMHEWEAVIRFLLHSQEGKKPFCLVGLISYLGKFLKILRLSQGAQLNMRAKGQRYGHTF